MREWFDNIFGFDVLENEKKNYLYFLKAAKFYCQTAKDSYNN
jgi:hypothetical protein